MTIESEITGYLQQMEGDFLRDNPKFQTLKESESAESLFAYSLVFEEYMDLKDQGEFKGLIEKLFKKLHSEFIKQEKAAGKEKLPDAVKARRFANFARDNTESYSFGSMISPDMFEDYSKSVEKKFKRTKFETYDDVEKEVRYLKTMILGYEFKKEVKFKGSPEAEVIAFHDFVVQKNDEHTQGFTEEEAEQGLKQFKTMLRKRNGALVGSLISAAILVGIFVSEFSKSPAASETPKDSGDGVPTQEQGEEEKSPWAGKIMKEDAPPSAGDQMFRK